MMEGRVFGDVFAEARRFVTDYLGKTALGLPGTLTEDEFKRIMDAVVQGMLAAWGHGYGSGRRRKGGA